MAESGSSYYVHPWGESDGDVGEGPLRFRFRSKKLETLYTAERGAKAYPAQVVDAFFEAMAVIVAASDERDLRAMKGFRFEKLRGDRAGQNSMRLNKQWRLVIELEKAIGAFVASPVFGKAVVDSRSVESAQSELFKIIQLSERLSRAADKLR